MQKKSDKKRTWSGAFRAAALFGLGLASPIIVRAEELPAPLGSASSSPDLLVSKIINIALGLLSICTLAIFIYGGFLFMLSGGNPEMLKKGKSTLVWAVIGLAIIMSSYGIVKYVFTVLGS